MTKLKEQTEPGKCPECGHSPLTSDYGGERGEAGPFEHCDECGWDEEELKKAKVANDANPMASVLAELIEKVAKVIDLRLGYTEGIKSAGGPYVTSLCLVAERKLTEAAVDAIQTIVNEPGLRPKPS